MMHPCCTSTKSGNHPPCAETFKKNALHAHGVGAHEQSNRKRCPPADWVFQRRQPPNGERTFRAGPLLFLWPRNQHNQNSYTNEKQKTTKTNNRVWKTNWTGYHAQPTCKHPNLRLSYGPLIVVAALLRLVTLVGDTEQQSARMQLHQAILSIQHQRCRQPMRGCVHQKRPALCRKIEPALDVLVCT